MAIERKAVVTFSAKTEDMLKSMGMADDKAKKAAQSIAREFTSSARTATRETGKFFNAYGSHISKIKMSLMRIPGMRAVFSPEAAVVAAVFNLASSYFKLEKQFESIDQTVTDFSENYKKSLMDMARSSNVLNSEMAKTFDAMVKGGTKAADAIKMVAAVQAAAKTTGSDPRELMSVLNSQFDAYKASTVDGTRDMLITLDTLATNGFGTVEKASDALLTSGLSKLGGSLKSNAADMLFFRNNALTVKQAMGDVQAVVSAFAGDPILEKWLADNGARITDVNGNLRSMQDVLNVIAESNIGREELLTMLPEKSRETVAKYVEGMRQGSVEMANFLAIEEKNRKERAKQIEDEKETLLAAMGDIKTAWGNLSGSISNSKLGPYFADFAHNLNLVAGAISNTPVADIKSKPVFGEKDYLNEGLQSLFGYFLDRSTVKQEKEAAERERKFWDKQNEKAGLPSGFPSVQQNLSALKSGGATPPNAETKGWVYQTGVQENKRAVEKKVAGVGGGGTVGGGTVGGGGGTSSSDASAVNRALILAEFNKKDKALAETIDKGNKAISDATKKLNEIDQNMRSREGMREGVAGKTSSKDRKKKAESMQKDIDRSIAKAETEEDWKKIEEKKKKQKEMLLGPSYKKDQARMEKQAQAEKAKIDAETAKGETAKKGRADISEKKDLLSKDEKTLTEDERKKKADLLGKQKESGKGGKDSAAQKVEKATESQGKADAEIMKIAEAIKKTADTMVSFASTTTASYKELDKKLNDLTKKLNNVKSKV